MLSEKNDTEWAPRPSVHSFHTRRTTRTDIVVERGLVTRGHVATFADLAEGSRHILITDEIVYELHAAAFVERVRKDVRLEAIVVPCGEQTKSLLGYQRLAERVLALGPDEQTTIIAFGGGMVCNLAGMVAATLFRGVRLVHIPTTLMAQCDAAISHKQAINASTGKNLLGAYYAPSRILVDPNVLTTLKPRQVQDGFAEVLKHAFAQDAAFLDQLRDPRASLNDFDFVARCVEHNIRLKCELMRVDPLERNEGMVLQYGHTVGHAVEHASGYRLGHGESVAVGMMVAAEVAWHMGLVDQEVVDEHASLLFQYALPTEVPVYLEHGELIDKVRAGKRCIGDTAYMALVGGRGVLHKDKGSCAIAVPISSLSRILEGSAPHGALYGQAP